MACPGPWRLLLQLASIMALVAPGSGNGYGQLHIRDYYYERLKVGGFTPEATATNEVKAIVAQIAPQLITKMKWPFNIWRAGDVTAISFQQPSSSKTEYYVKVHLMRQSDLWPVQQQLYLSVAISTKVTDQLNVQGWTQVDPLKPTPAYYLTPPSDASAQIKKLFGQVKDEWLKSMEGHPTFTNVQVWGYREVVNVQDPDGSRHYVVGVSGTTTKWEHAIVDNYVVRFAHDPDTDRVLLHGYSSLWASFPSNNIRRFPIRAVKGPGSSGNQVLSTVTVFVVAFIVALGLV